MTALDSMYRDLPAALARLGAAAPDVDPAIPWDDDRPGDALPSDLLTDLGVDAAPLRAEAEAWELLQWSAALAICERVVQDATRLAEFLDATPTLRARPELTRLRERAQAQVAVFRRLGDGLRDQRPADGFAFDRLFDELVGGGDLPPAGSLSLAQEQLRSWGHALLAAERARDLAARLAAAPDLQPRWRAALDWLAVSQADARAVAQICLAALEVSDDERDAAASSLEEAVARDLDAALGLRIALRLVQEARPDLASPVAAPAGESPAGRRLTDRLRRALHDGPPPPPSGPSAERAPAPPRSAAELERWLVTALAEVLDLDPAQLDGATELTDLPLDSLAATALAERFERHIGRRVSPTIVWDHPTVSDVAQRYASLPSPQDERA